LRKKFASGVSTLSQPRDYVASAPQYLELVTMLDYSTQSSHQVDRSKAAWSRHDVWW